MARLTFDELVRFVRKHSPFYQALYQNLPQDPKLQDLPVLSQEAFWEANTLHENKVLTGPMHDGVVFKSGGTTGNPKFSIFSKEEWRVFLEIFGRGISQGGLEAGDRVVNLFYVGQLYGSFLFINNAIEKAPVDVLQLPVAGSTEFSETMQVLSDFKVNVLAGVPTTILNLAEYIKKHAKDPKAFQISKVLFGGEPVYPDQRARLSEIFPGVKILTIGYASTDAGLLGYADSSCLPGEHRCFGEDTILEILDEDTHKPIHEINREGVVVVTNLTRTLMPIVRYPVGDKGKWLEPVGAPDRKFLLLGRSEEAARIGLVKLYVQDVRSALSPFRDPLKILDFQLVVIHRELKDGLILRIASEKEGKELDKHSPSIIKAIYEARPLYEEFVRDSKIFPIEVQWVQPQELETNHRTGKLRRLIDQRFQS